MSTIKSILIEDQGLAKEGKINFSKELIYDFKDSVKIIGSSIGGHFTGKCPTWLSLCLSKNPIERSDKYGGEKNGQLGVINHCEHEGSENPMGGLEKHISNTIMFSNEDFIWTNKVYLKAIVPFNKNSVKMWALIFYKESE